MSEYIYASNGESLTNEHGKISLSRKRIVRCRDCDNLNIVGKCPCGFFAMENLDGFCAWGKRKGGGGATSSKTAVENWNRRVEQAIAATHGRLTAEQVRAAILSGSSYAKRYGAKYYADGINIQVIADELNAELGSGTCRITASATDGLCSDNPRKWFELSCGHTFMLYGLGTPVACAVCGKVVGE